MVMRGMMQVPLEIKDQGTRLIKYGVVSSSTLCQDLQNWTTLYLSGRMHKPVRNCAAFPCVSDG